MSIIDATVGGAQSNSYCDVATATARLTQWRLYCPEWTAATQSDQETALIWATALLDNIVRWNGYKATLQQRLRWPRSGCYDPDHFYVQKDVIPVQIQDITAQLAYELIKQNRLAEIATVGLGVTDATIGPLRVHIDPHQALPFIPPYLQAMLPWWGVLNVVGPGQGMFQAKLERT